MTFILEVLLFVQMIPRDYFMRLLSVTAFFLSLLSSTFLLAASKYDIAVISDGPNQQPNPIEVALIDELVALTEGEFEITIKRYQADWTLPSIERAFQQAYANSAIDMLLVTGIAANQVGVARKSFDKPTFLPVVFDVELMGAPIEGDVSGKTNLNYLVSQIEFQQNLSNFKRLAPMKKIALIGDQVVFEAVPTVIKDARRVAKEEGVDLVFIGHDGQNDDLVSAIADGVDGVMVAAFPRMSEIAYLAMIDDLNRRKLPSFSFLGSERVAQGLLFTDTPNTDWGRLARRNALNMQAVMLGASAAEIGVFFETKSELTLNMETARQISLSPSFDLLAEAVQLNRLPENQGTLYSLVDVAELALAQNLQLSAEAYGLSAGQSDVRKAKSSLLPQLSLGSSYTQRKKSDAVLAGQLAEKSSDGSISLSQQLYSDSSWANLTIQRYLQNNREASFEQSKLEIVQAATIAYLNVLRAQTQVRVRQDNLNLTKTNLELARDRVRVGFSSSADVYRWESSMASDRATLLQSTADLNQARENLNRLLHRPISAPFRVADVTETDPFALSPDEFTSLIYNPRSYGYYTDFVLQMGFDLSPELAQLKAQMGANQREIVNRKRAFWLPDFSINGRYGENFDQSGLGVGSTEGDSDWDVSVTASIPLFDSGLRRTELSRSRLERKQLMALFDAAHEQVEQQIRANIHEAVASFANIKLSKQAASSAAKNLELVTDSYAKGLVSIIDLLDAQNAGRQADEAAANAVYDFLIDIMNMQRSVGLFEFMLSDGEKQAWTIELKDYLQRRQREEG